MLRAIQGCEGHKIALAHRINLAREVTRIRNRIHSLLDKYDFRCEYDTITGVHGMNWLKSIRLDGDYDQGILESLIRQVEFLKKEEEEANSRIASYALQNKYVPIIMSMSGFDYYSASLLSAYIADIERFPSPSHLVSWAGMCPSVHQSGETLYHGKMKDGSKKVQWIMTQAANAAIRSDTRLKTFYERKFKRHHHNVAISHVANKMLTILWCMLKENRLYNERKEKLYDSKLKRAARIAR